MSGSHPIACIYKHEKFLFLSMKVLLLYGINKMYYVHINQEIKKKIWISNKISSSPEAKYPESERYRS